MMEYNYDIEILHTSSDYKQTMCVLLVGQYNILKSTRWNEVQIDELFRSPFVSAYYNIKIIEFWILHNGRSYLTISVTLRHHCFGKIFT